MKIKKNHIYVGMIAIAGTAWCVDRFVLGGGFTQPATATAAPLAPAAAIPVTQAAPVAVPAGARSSSTLAVRFATVNAIGSRDAFVPPPQWIPAAEAAPGLTTSQAPAVPAPVVFDAAAFRAQHRLTAVLMRGRNSGAAIIDGKMVDVGGSFMGLKLRELTPTSATLTGPDYEVILTGDTPTAHDAAAPSNPIKSPR